MRRSSIWTLALALAVFGSLAGCQSRAGDSVDFACEPAKGSEAAPKVIGYLPYWDQERGLRAIESGLDVLTEVSPFWYTLDESGSVIRFEGSRGQDRSVLDLLCSNGVMVTPTIANLRDDGNWDGELVSSIINDPERLERHIAEIVEVAVSGPYDGVNLDYEGLVGEDRQAFSSFVDQLADALHEHGKELSVAVAAKTSEPGRSETGRAQDYEALGEAADEIRLMAYDYHWTSSPPGPVAPIDWVQQVLDFALSKIPQEKVVLGLGLYGVDWAEGRGRQVEWEQLLATANRFGAEIMWDASSMTLWFEYVDEHGREHTVWFENAFSVEHKLEVAERSGVSGVHFWRLGGEDPRTWEVVGSSAFGH